jgi:hypothetical protein
MPDDSQELLTAPAGAMLYTPSEEDTSEEDTSEEDTTNGK